MPETTLIDDEQYETRVFKHCDFSKSIATNIRFEDVYFHATTLSQTKFVDVKFRNIKFEECNLANTVLEKAHIEHAEFIKCQMTGFKYNEANMNSVLLKDYKLSLSQFRFSKLKNMTCIHCIFEESDFYHTDLSGAVITNCDLTKSEFSESMLKDTDLRTSNLAGIKIGIKDLHGAIIDPSQVSDLSWLLGATIEWKE